MADYDLLNLMSRQEPGKVLIGARAAEVVIERARNVLYNHESKKG